MKGAAPRLEAILFDFFGTLVRYSPSRTAQGYEQTHALLRERGIELSYRDFLDAWVAASEELDRWSRESGREFSMDDVAARFFARVAPERATPELRRDLWSSYVSEWEKGISHIPGVREMLGGLAARFRLAIVTNTHHAPLISRHLAALGAGDLFAAVVTSIEHGRPKPHESIFRHALDRLGCAPAAALFVGDSFEADYSGARRAGLRALLIDPNRTSAAPADHRLASILDLPSELERG